MSDQRHPDSASALGSKPTGQGTIRAAITPIDKAVSIAGFAFVAYEQFVLEHGTAARAALAAAASSAIEAAAPPAPAAVSAVPPGAPAT